MRVGVIGAGGIGGLYGGLLARAGHDVRFLARGQHLAAMQAHGLRVESAQFGTFTVQARASDTREDLGPGEADLVLFTVKTYDLEAAAPAARDLLAPDGSLVTFQNGVDAPDRLAELVGSERVLIGTTGLETTILEPGVIGHLSTTHYVFVGALHGPPTARVATVVEALRGAGINAAVAEDGRRALWEKAYVLLPMATITSVTQSPIGPIRDLPETRALIEALLDEVMAVASAYGYALPEARRRAAEIIYNWAPDGKASMARDFERGNRTELEALTGTLVRMADAKNVVVPVSKTAYALLKLRSAMAEIPLGTVTAGR
ncbi:MAG: 2-dehydropantoate 2-reductase [Chloroflexi bacterium]|nr:2-dehydropantoate 2-reductase [Chloroflexota bacterium]